MFLFKKEEREPHTHDIYNYNVVRGSAKGDTIRIHGFNAWRDEYVVGDYAVLHYKGGSAQYKFDELEFPSDPKDQWFATVSFAPRAICDKCDTSFLLADVDHLTHCPECGEEV